jgi:hypothetical protein
VLALALQIEQLALGTFAGAERQPQAQSPCPL